MFDGTQERDTILKHMFFPHLEELRQFGTVSACRASVEDTSSNNTYVQFTDNKPHIWELFADLGCCCYQQVHPLPIRESRYDDDIHSVAFQFCVYEQAQMT